MRRSIIAMGEEASTRPHEIAVGILTLAGRRDLLSYRGAYAVGLYLAGAIADRKGRKR